jgi:hypothetical protein
MFHTSVLVEKYIVSPQTTTIDICDQRKQVLIKVSKQIQASQAKKARGIAFYVD